MKNKFGPLLFVLTVSFTNNILAQTSSLSQTLSNQQMIQSGRILFTRHCSGCHGNAADGQGPASQMLNPKPRNLVTGSFKFRSTPTGTLPTHEDLIRTIDQGIVGSSMPSFRLLSHSEKLSLAMFIKSLRADWKESEGSSISIPDPPKDIFGTKSTLLASAFHGRKLFIEACQTCHGDKGLGDGPSVDGMVDSENRSIRPANLTKKIIKSGPSAKDVFKAISTGLDGTPMPSFADTYSEAQRWNLVAYVFYLRGIGSGTYSESADTLTDPSKQKKNKETKTSTSGDSSWN